LKNRTKPVLLILALLITTSIAHASPELSITVSMGKSSYLPGEDINVYGDLTAYGNPAEGLVAVWINSPNGEPMIIRTSQTGTNLAPSFLKVINVYPSDIYGNPKDSYIRGIDVAYFNITLKNTHPDPTNMMNLTISITIYDSNSVSLAAVPCLSGYPLLGNNSVFTSLFPMPIPSWASLGSANAFVSICSDYPYPPYNGHPYVPETAAPFQIVEMGGGSLTTPQSTPSATALSKGAYQQTFKLNPKSVQAKLGTYNVYVTGYIPGEDLATKTAQFNLVKQVTNTYQITVEPTTYNVVTVSNSSISNFTFTTLAPGGEISFNATGLEDTKGFCNITIPKSLMWGSFTVYVDGNPPLKLIQSSNATHTSLYFTYWHSTRKIQVQSTEVIPEFPTSIIPLLFTIMSLTTVIMAKAWSKKRRSLLKIS